ncbi:MAG: hypothetical protein OEQ47_05365 [Acidimicrobiia bacterium]|nr:hypothetical protein [Acidimicrobiia bacterium]
MTFVRRLVTVAAAAVMLIGIIPASAQQFPDEIALPDGFFPEGIAVGRGSSFYVGSLADGSVFKGDLATGEGEVVVAPTGPFSTVGIEVDQRNRIWVAGGPTGTGRVYDGDTGGLLATFQFTDAFDSFVNDVVVTSKAAYFTDSGTANSPDPGNFQFAGEPRLFVVPIGAAGEIDDDFDEVAVDAPDIAFPNLNGIDTLPGSRRLVVAHTVGGVLFDVDPTTGEAEAIDIGVVLEGADGLVRSGNVVYVVENTVSRISAIKFTAGSSRATVEAVYEVAGAETPTTADLFGNAIYTVDARFGSMTGPYNVFRVELN